MPPPICPAPTMPIVISFAIGLPRSPSVLGSAVVEHDAADRFTAVHEIEAAVDVPEGHGVRDQLVDPDLPLHVPVDDLGHVRPAASTAEGAALPDATGDELERPRRDLLPGP